MLNIFEVCKEDASKLERFGVGEFFCLKLKLDPSKRTELVPNTSRFDKFSSDEKISFSVRTVNGNMIFFYYLVIGEKEKKKLTSNFLLFI